MYNNSFELIGRIGWKELKYSENGTAIATINLGVKNKDAYQNFFIKFLNSTNSANRTAEKLVESQEVGSYIRVKGALSLDKYTPTGSVKTVEKVSLLGWGFCPVKWSEEEKRFIDDEKNN